MALKCDKCGEELLGAVNRCWRCGGRVDQVVAASVPPPAGPALAVTPTAADGGEDIVVAELAQASPRHDVPPSLWPRVVTLYEEGRAARDFIGDGGGQRAQVVLLDPAGVVAFHDAGGFRDEAAAALAAAAAALGA